MAGVVIAAIGALIAALQPWDGSASDDMTATRPRVVFMSYVDEAEDRRGLRDFEAFGEALRAADPEVAGRVALEFVQVSVGGSTSIEEAIGQAVATRPAAIIATSDDVLHAAQQATDAIPILFASHADPVAAGYVKSIAAPGVQRTGFTYHVPLTQKMVEILVDAFPRARHIGVVADRLRADAPTFAADVRAAHAVLGVDVDVFIARNAQELQAVVDSPAAGAVDAWYVPVGEVLWNDEQAVLDVMQHSGKPVLYERTRLARKGGVLAYEPRLTNPWGILASQLVLILKGADAATIPVERPSQFELAVNLSGAADNPALRPTKRFIRRVNTVFAQDRTSP